MILLGEPIQTIEPDRMKIQFLESCFGDPLLQMATTYVVNDRLAVDAGCLGMAKIGLQDRVGDVVVTHVHADHVASLPVYVVNRLQSGLAPARIHAPADVIEMASHGVDTLFLQAARTDDRSGLATSDPWVLADFLLHGHRNGVNVVAWYLPMWAPDGQDLDRLLALHRFEVLGHRFDGLAVDIEWNGGGLQAVERTARLVDLTVGLREATVGDPLGAIVMPPLLTDEINPDFWPGFPWAALADHFDVWLPMSYWSFRTEEHSDPRYYSAESIRMLRDNLGDSQALVHGIGGVGAADGTALPDSGEPMATIGDLEGFVASLADTGSIGGSIYDWATTGPEARRRLAELFADRALG